MKSVNKPKYGSRTILTDSCWEYVALFLKRQSMAGASDALFYWEQAHSFYLASQELPDNARPLTSYYCIFYFSQSDHSFLKYSKSYPTDIIISIFALNIYFI